MGVISLEGLEYFAFHGVYDEERRIGNRFLIDVHIEVDLFEAGISDELADTVDYQRVAALVGEVMQGASKLLETIAASIISSIRNTYPEVKEVVVKVSKLNPPIGVICKRSSITMKG